MRAAQHTAHLTRAWARYSIINAGCHHRSQYAQKMSKRSCQMDGTWVGYSALVEGYPESAKTLPTQILLKVSQKSMCRSVVHT